ncbi:hypothetical protein TYRP_001271 [Tyrophagus putrescentiae]|nr:hypothetical protein TYRP_001271 [Tyrophagus putrescentiae]
MAANTSVSEDLESASKFELLLKVEELQGDLKLKEKDLKSKDLEINRWKEQVNKLNLESVPRQALEDFQKQYDVAIEKNSNLHEQLHAKTQELADIKKENDNLYQRINEKDDTEQSKNKFYEQLKATKSELKLLTIAHNTLKEKYKEKDREVEYYKNELRKVNLENSQLNEVISASQKRKSLNISSVSLLEGSFSFSGDIDPRASPPKSIVGETIADMLVPVLEEEKKALSAANDLANQKNAELQNEMKSLVSSMNVLKEDNSKLFASKEALAADLASKSNENQQLIVNLETFEFQITELQSEAKQKDDVICHLQNQIDSLASSNNVLKDDYSQMSASKELLTINLASKSSENQRLRASLELCESQKASAFQQIELLEQKIKNLESGVNSKCNENQKLRATLELCENQRDSALKRVELLENEAKSKEEAFRKLSAELKLEQQSFEMERKTKERLIKENAKLELNVKKLKTERDALTKTKTEAASSEKCSSEKRLQQLAHRNSMLQPHLRSTYPVELQVADVQALPGSDENSIRRGSVQSLCSAASSLSRSHTSDSTTSISTAEFFAPLGPPPARRQTRSQMYNGGAQRPAGLSIENLGPSRPQHSVTASTSQASTSPSRSRRKSPITYSVSVEDIPQKRSRTTASSALNAIQRNLTPSKIVRRMFGDKKNNTPSKKGSKNRLDLSNVVNNVFLCVFDLLLAEEFPVRIFPGCDRLLLLCFGRPPSPVNWWRLPSPPLLLRCFFTCFSCVLMTSTASSDWKTRGWSSQEVSMTTISSMTAKKKTIQMATLRIMSLSDAFT